MAETRFKLVPVEPTKEMQIAGTNAAAARLMKVRELPAIAYRAMLQAAPEPSPEMVDELCKAMWGNFLHWRLEDTGGHPHHKMLQAKRKMDRARMRAFLQRIGEQK